MVLIGTGTSRHDNDGVLFLCVFNQWVISHARNPYLDIRVSRSRNDGAKVNISGKLM